MGIVQSGAFQNDVDQRETLLRWMTCHIVENRQSTKRGFYGAVKTFLVDTPVAAPSGPTTSVDVTLGTDSQDQSDALGSDAPTDGLIMPPRRVFRGYPTRRNVEEQGVGQQKGARKEVADTSRIREFLRLNPPSITGSRTTEDPKSLVEELKKKSQGSVPQGGNLHVLSVVGPIKGNKSQSSSVAPLDSVAPRGATFDTGGGRNRLYTITSRQKQETSPDVVTGASLSTVGLLALLLFCFREKKLWYKYIRFWESNAEDHQKVEEFLKNYGSYAPNRYNYTDIKRITGRFRSKLGQGGFGNVYRGRRVVSPSS
ncbi:uncharacterized protein LOC125814891 [Solanum verrucosum]|uniref:uncharacterized protein LOC125814891 n=1 Tax=Solanum verrucosum TaxID=315347 RepID=UPI0020D0A008|nr:uncharacterized protein LOC125814891 [Solanum verrucosum]